MNFYAILGIPSDADAETIRSAYRVLARRYHPDAGAGSSEEKFRQVVEAYETLSDPTRRAQYDVSCLDVSQVNARRYSDVPVESMTALQHPFGVHVWEVSPFAEPYRQSDFAAVDLVFELLRSLEDDFFFGGPWPGF